MPATAPVDNPVDFSDIVDASTNPFAGVLAGGGAVLVADSVGVLRGFERVVLNDVVLEEVMLEDEAELLGDVVSTDDVGSTANGLLEDVLDGAKVETVAPEGPIVTISMFKGTLNRPIPESQHILT